VRDWYAAWASYSQDVEQLVDLGEGRVLALGHENGRSRAAGVELKGEFGTVYHVRNGRINRIDAFQNWAKARRAAGLEGAPDD
jgi:ketosteroid isomerase-like protein